MKSESLGVSLTRLILVITILVLFGAILGVAGYLAKNKQAARPLPQVLFTPTPSSLPAGEILESKSDIKIGKGELDNNIDIVAIQKDVDQGDQSWKLRYGCMGCTDEEVKKAVPIPTRVEPDLILKEMGKSFGFTKEDLDNFNLEKPYSEKGKKIYKIHHNSDLYLVTLTQPMVDYYKIWIISEIAFYKKECNPKLVGIEIENKVTRVFEEKDRKLNQITSPEQFKERGYNEYCIIWRNITNLSSDIINELPSSDLLGQSLNIKNWNLYKNDISGFQFYYPKEWSYKEYRDRKYILFNGSLEIRIDFFSRSNQWAIEDISSLSIDGQKTFLLLSKDKANIDSKTAYLAKTTNANHNIYLEFLINKLQDKEIFSSILSTFRFTEKDSSFSCGTSTVKDIENNAYNTVQIGEQCWLKENLKVTKNPADEAITRYCYDNNPKICDTDGGLYDWNTAMDNSTIEGTQGICPNGWHIPKDSEWYVLENYLTDKGQTCDNNRNGWDCDSAGTKLKSDGSSNFKGVLSGYRESTGLFSGRDSRSTDGYLWSSTENGTDYAWRRIIWVVYSDSIGTFLSSKTNRSVDYKKHSLSVRCLKD